MTTRPESPNQQDLVMGQDRCSQLKGHRAEHGQLLDGRAAASTGSSSTGKSAAEQDHWLAIAESEQLSGAALHARMDDKKAAEAAERNERIERNRELVASNKAARERPRSPHQKGSRRPC